MYICTIESPCCVPETLLSQLYFNEKYIFFKVLIRLINKDIRSWGKIETSSQEVEILKEFIPIG